MEIDRSERHESFAAAFQCREIEALSHTLARHGIVDPALRRKICGEFLAVTAARLDRGWMRVDGEIVHPTMCFAKGASPEEAINQPKSLSVPSAYFAFEDHLSGNLYHYFEEKRENLGDLARGYL